MRPPASLHGSASGCRSSHSQRRSATRPSRQHRSSFAYYLGGMTLFLFGMQVGTGALLLLYLPAERERSVRERAVHHDARAVRLAGSIDSCVVGEPDGGGRGRAPFSVAVPPFLSPAARAHLGERRAAAWR